jgi:ribose 5-phosphate isomerase
MRVSHGFTERRKQTRVLRRAPVAVAVILMGCQSIFPCRRRLGHGRKLSRSQKRAPTGAGPDSC